MSIELKDKLYTSTQVAEILGVSLRTLYRYMEDSRIASMRTASGRHRFTKDQILDFLNGGEGLAPQGTSFSQPVQPSTPVAPVESVESPSVGVYSHSQVETKVDTSHSVINDDVKGKQSVSGFDKEDLKPLSLEDTNFDDDSFDLSSDPIVAENPVKKQPFENVEEQTFKPFNPSPIEPKVATEPVRASDPIMEMKSTVEPKPIESGVVDLANDMNIRYYKSDNTDLIKLAKKIHEVATSKDLEYAFSGYAGLSLHFLIKPFTLLHFYGNPEDMQIWREELSLSPVSKKEESNIGVIINTDIVFVPSKEMGGFNVVEDKVLLRDLSEHKEDELVRQFRLHLANATS